MELDVLTGKGEDEGYRIYWNHMWYAFYLYAMHITSVILESTPYNLHSIPTQPSLVNS